MPIPDIPDPTAGQVLVTATYDVAPGSEAEFLSHRDQLRHFRQRTGGEDWRLFVDNAAESRYVEVFLVESWEEHERQHERETQHDASLLDTLDGLLVPGTHRVGHHYFSAPSEAAPNDSDP